MTTQGIADYLETGFWNDFSKPLDFGTSEPHNWHPNKSTISYDVSDLSQNGQDLVENALTRWASIIDVEFKPVRGIADLDFEKGNSNFAEVSYPGNTPLVIGNSEIVTSATVTLSGINASDSNTTQTFTTILHEIGHALGLGHAGPYNASGDILSDGSDFSHAIFADDSDQKTVMSYFTQRQNPNVSADQASPITPQIADILAIKSIYGLDSDTRDLDTTYGYGAREPDHARGGSIYNFDPGEWGGNNASFTIYDTGGTDTVNMNAATTDQRIDLRPGEFSNVGDGADVSNGGNTLQGNMTIAPGVDIEHATGGTADDVLIGNELDNRLFGHRGEDTLRGLAGDDTFWFGASLSTTLKTDTDVADTIKGGAGHDRVKFQDSDTTYDFDDATVRTVEEIEFAPGSTNQTIALTSEQMRGSGTDLGGVLVDNARNGTLEIEMTGSDLDLSALTFNNATPRSPSVSGPYFAQVTGKGADESITTTRLADKIVTGGGEDVVTAGAGDDQVKATSDTDLRAGAGNDTVDFSASSFDAASINLAAGKVYQDGWFRFAQTTLDPFADNPRIQVLSGVENVDGASGGNTIRGNEGANILDGNAGRDDLHPNGGADVLTGGADADTFVFEPKTGADNVITDFGTGADVLDLTAFDFEDTSEVKTSATEVSDGLQITLDSRTKEFEYFVEDPVPHVETGTTTVYDRVTLEGMVKSDLGSSDLRLDSGGPGSSLPLVDVYRFYNKEAGGHFYTTSNSEAQNVRNSANAFRDEGAGFEALSANASDLPSAATEVYRFYNKAAGGHFYTTDLAEAQRVRENLDNFRDEGVGFQAFDSKVAGTVPVYRFYNKEAGGHFYTPSEDEAEQVRQNLPSFRDEGIGFFAYPDEIDLPENFDFDLLGVNTQSIDGIA